MDQVMVPLDESSLRKSKLNPGQPVVLADGQSWMIPCPRIVYLPDFGPNGGFRIEAVSTFGPEFDRKVQILRDAESVPDEAAALLGVAVDLLGRNYDLGPEQYRALLRYETGAEEVNQPLAEIYRIATGYGVAIESNQPT